MARVTFYFDVGEPVAFQSVPRETVAQWLDLFAKTTVEDLVFRYDEDTVTAVPRHRLVHIEVDPDDGDTKTEPRNQGDY